MFISSSPTEDILFARYRPSAGRAHSGVHVSNPQRVNVMLGDKLREPWWSMIAASLEMRTGRVGERGTIGGVPRGISKGTR